MNTMLNSIRGLAVHAANTSANDSSSIEADQTAVDKAIESIQRIATTTKFSGKNLLDGSASNASIGEISGTGASGTDGITINLATFDSDAVKDLVGTDSNGEKLDSANVTVNVTASATFATAISSAAIASGTTGKVNLTVGSTTASVTIAAGDNKASIAGKLNTAFASLGVDVTLVSDKLSFSFTDQYGEDNEFSIVVTTASLAGALNLTASAANASATATGTNVEAELKNGSNTVALSATGAFALAGTTSGWTDLTITLSSGRATTTASASQGVFTLNNANELKFSLTPDAAKTDIISFGISNMQTEKMGLGATGLAEGYDGLEAIMNGESYSLATDPESAILIIDKAISDVSSQRAELGSFQKFSLETTINNLGVTRENLTASESRIRDVDMAQEMMEFMKNQILVQAGTAMLAQANQVQSSVLQLLG
jgi:flagellin